MKPFFSILFLFILPATVVLGQEHPVFFAYGTFMFPEFGEPEIYDVDNPLIINRTEKFLAENESSFSLTTFNGQVPADLGEKYFFPKTSDKLWAFSFRDSQFLGITKPTSYFMYKEAPVNDRKYILSFVVDFKSLKVTAKPGFSLLNTGDLILVWVPKNTKAEYQPHLLNVSKDEQKGLLKKVLLYEGENKVEGLASIRLVLTAMGSRYFVLNLKENNIDKYEIYKVQKNGLLKIYTNWVSTDE